MGQQKCAGADGSGKGSGVGRTRDPFNDGGALEFRHDHAAGDDEKINGRMLADGKVGVQHQSAAGADRANRIGDGEYFERFGRAGMQARLHARRGGKDLERPAEIEHLDFVKDVDSDVAGHGAGVLASHGRNEPGSLDFADLQPQD